MKARNGFAFLIIDMTVREVGRLSRESQHECSRLLKEVSRAKGMLSTCGALTVCVTSILAPGFAPVLGTFAEINHLTQNKMGFALNEKTDPSFALPMEDDDITLVKNKPSCVNPVLSAFLISRRIRTVFLGGLREGVPKKKAIESVTATAQDLLAKRFVPIILDEATNERRSVFQAARYNQNQRAGIQICSIDQAVQGISTTNTRCGLI